MSKVTIRLVFDRKNTATKTHPASVQIEATFQRKRNFFGTGIKLSSDQWNGNSLQVKNHPHMQELNQQLNDLVAKIYDCIHQMSSKGIEFIHLYSTIITVIIQRPYSSLPIVAYSDFYFT